MDVGVKLEGEEDVKVEVIDPEGREHDVKLEPVDQEEVKETVEVSNADVKLEILEEELEEKLYSCDVCNKKFIIRALWASHMKTHGASNEYPYSCSECGQTFRREEFLVLHKSNCNMLVKPPKKKTRIFKCFYCTKEFTDFKKQSLHTKRCGTWCDLCSRYFSSRGALNRHIMSKHSGKIMKREVHFKEFFFACE